MATRVLALKLLPTSARAHPTGPRRRRGRWRALALFALAPLVACRQDPPEPARVRLVEPVDDARFESDGAAIPSPPFAPSFLPGPPDDKPGALRVARFSAAAGDSDSRVVLPALGRSRYRYELDAPRQAELRLALGLAAEAPLVSASARFVVRVGRPGGSAPRVLLDETLTGAPSATWQERRVPLAGLGGGRVLVELESDARGGAGAAWATPEIVDAGALEAGPNVILVSLDTLRADHLGSYGYRRPTSPFLDGLGRRGFRFETAISQAPWTRPSHRSMLSGLFPTSSAGLLSPQLSEMFWRGGYRSLAVTGGGQVDPRFGFGGGFEIYQVREWLREPDQALARIDERPGERFFLFLHSWEPHDPYEDGRFARGLPSGRIVDRFEHSLWRRWRQRLTDDEKAYAEALYDGDIARADEGIRDLFAGLERRGLLANTIVVVTSDHGEQFWEHGTWRHGMHLWDHQTHVPLFLYVPPALRASLGLLPDLPGQGRVIADQVSLVDLYPTLLDLAGIPLEHRVQGRSLLPLLRGERLPPNDAFSEDINIAKLERKSLRTEKMKFIWTIGTRADHDVGPEFLLFDLRRDPGERANLAPTLAAATAALAARVDAIRAGGAAERDEEVPENVDPELRRQLEALGYIGH